MKISLLKLKNCLSAKELEFKPGEITIIQGAEGKGKTSILESIQRFFYNKSERSEFVYSVDGEKAEKAEIYIDLDDGTEMKKYINKDNKVTTTSIVKGELSPKNPESYLKGLVSDKQLNPISLIEMKDKELSELILSLIPIKVTTENLMEWVREVPEGINLDKHGLQVCKDVEKYFYEKRTDLNRTIKDLQAEVKLLKAKLPTDYKVDEWRNVSLTDKYEEIRNANEINADILKNEAILSGAEARIEALRDKCRLEISEAKQESALKKQEIADKIAELKKQIELLEKDLQHMDGTLDAKTDEITAKYKEQADEIGKETLSAKEFIETNKTIDIAPLEESHKHIEEMKSFVRTADDLAEKEVDLVAKEKESETLTLKIDQIRIKPQGLLAKADMPVEGITVDAGGSVLINERPIINLSGGERIKFVMNIVRATAGELKIILIDGFEKLSPSAQMQFINECKNDGFQYIITAVTDGDLTICAINEAGQKINAETGELMEDK